MSIRTRKLIGAVLLLLLVTVWSLLAMAFAQFAFSSPNAIAAWIFYVVAGTRLGPARDAADQVDGRRRKNLTVIPGAHAQHANPESILPLGVMDSGPAASRRCPAMTTRLTPPSVA